MADLAYLTPHKTTTLGVSAIKIFKMDKLEGKGLVNYGE